MSIYAFKAAWYWIPNSRKWHRFETPEISLCERWDFKRSKQEPNTHGIGLADKCRVCFHLDGKHR